MINKVGDIANVISKLRGEVNAFILARLADEGITELVPSHGAILVALYESGPQSMKAIGERVNRDKSTLTVLVRKLEALGYVSRESDDTDNRIVRVSLTEKGAAFRSIFEKVSNELTRKIWGDVPEEEKELIYARLMEMCKRLEP